MVIGHSSHYSGAKETPAPNSPWKRVEEAQLDARTPCLLVPQPAHAVMAGDLAAALLPEVFGELPAEITQSILMHDTGWAMIDAAQIQRLRSNAARGTKPMSFVAASPQESEEAWTASINSVERLSPAGGMVVSRHFALLAGQSEHRNFVAAERTRQRRLAAQCGAPALETARWVAALGFCDLLSLYLLCGFEGEAAFPLAHPATPEARNAPHVTLTIDDGLLHFLPQIFHSGSKLELDTLRHPIEGGGSRVERLSWKIV
jgi:hypothetical protein